jgi:glutaredoxin
MSISVDSAAVHAAFGESLGGISYPMLADFHPKGAMATDYGVYQEQYGTIERATVIVDASGLVQHASATGKRDMEALTALCKEIDSKHDPLPEGEAPAGLPGESTLFVRDNCGASTAVLRARTNLHLDSMVVKNVSQSEESMKELRELSGAETAPVLVVGGEVKAESIKILRYLADSCTTL